MESTGLAPDPRLPLDLERTIFELAALSFPKAIPIFLLIAWRVKKWVEPILYRVLIIAPDTSGFSDYPVFSQEIILRKISNPALLQDSVRHLFMDDSTPSAELGKIILACSRVISLAYSSPEPSQDLFLHKDCLRHLTISVDAFIACLLPESSRDDLLPNLTHLELLDTFGSLHEFELPADVSRPLALIPNLTHLALNGIQYNASLINLLRVDSRLLCIVLFCDGVNPDHPLSNDDRVVFVKQHADYRLDWVRGINTGESYWSLADSFIAARRGSRLNIQHHKINDNGLLLCSVLSQN
ncbi:hypothetical protein C8F04DRAFT_1122599 [Mycena alexandri]|uniref:Uncharacterized protein n=1 Tax=Mycena alexandri TaxID=1745969 RepID=A0AAD6SGP6_9AGAR|nr:hypothetical protein C8F04DRAFT_1122599 [Mycena alexandri]